MKGARPSPLKKKRNMLYDCSYIKFWEMKTYGDSKWAGSGDRGKGFQRKMRMFSRVMDVFVILIVVMASEV